MVHADRVTGDKVEPGPALGRPVRGRQRAASCAVPGTSDYLEELCSFPLGAFDDQVDASSGAFNKLSHGAAAEWTPEEIARVGRRWRGEEVGSGETYLEYHRRLRKEREVGEATGAQSAQTARTPQELAAEKRRAYGLEVAETNRLALIRARGGR